MTEKAEFQ